VVLTTSHYDWYANSSGSWITGPSLSIASFIYCRGYAPVLVEIFNGNFYWKYLGFVVYLRIVELLFSSVVQSCRAYKD
jgi:hypothetical protein